MPDDVPDEGWTAEETEPSTESSVGHDDIMKRLLDYQRSLREGATPEEAADVAGRPFPQAPPREGESPPATGLLDLTSVDEEVEIEPAEPAEPAQPESEPAEPVPGLPASVEPSTEPQPEIAVSSEPEIAVEAPPPPSAEAEGSPTPSPEAETPRVPEFAPSAFRLEPRTAEAGISQPELEARLTNLEARLDRLGSRLGELRRSFQEMAVAADEHIAAMEEEIDRVRGERERES